MPHPRRAPYYRPVPSRTDHRLHAEIRGCNVCGLRDTCNGPVPPVGSPDAAVMLVLEAPGYHEDEYGIPVTGATWEELEPLLEAAGLSRDTVWITNAVMCRPPGDPTLADAAECWDLWKPVEIEYVKPRVVVLLGELAIKKALGTNLTVTGVRGYPVWKPDWNAWILPTYHPAAALRQDAYRVALYEDFASLRRLKLGEVWERPKDLVTPRYVRGLPVEVQALAAANAATALTRGNRE